MSGSCPVLALHFIASFCCGFSGVRFIIDSGLAKLTLKLDVSGNQIEHRAVYRMPLNSLGDRIIQRPFDIVDINLSGAGGFTATIISRAGCWLIRNKSELDFEQNGRFTDLECGFVSKFSTHHAASISEACSASLIQSRIEIRSSRLRLRDASNPLPDIPI